ncbi:hypothetical protein [Spongiimicrobium salis]|uniref:hypothetical protein n=1 Tax=Spongiimicrobium salis TaxID=1667022 RepID=UPI00374DB719
MIKKILLLLVFIASTTLLQAQKKKDLLLEIDDLKEQLATLEGELTTAKKNERVSTARVTDIEAQLAELRKTNADLLQNLTDFTTKSTEKSDNIGIALESLREKENQLKVINDALSRLDSTAIAVLTNVKQTLGDDAQTGVSKGSVIISASIAALFKEKEVEVVSEAGQAWLEKIAIILNANPDMGLEIAGLTNTGEFDIAFRQATAIANILQKEFQIDPKRLSAKTKDGGFSDGIQLKIHPKYDAFHSFIKEHMKNAG